MKIDPDCRPCLLRQMELTARAAGAGESVLCEVSRAAVEELDRVWDDDASPPAVSAPLYRLTGQICRSDDPFLAVKVKYTREALKLLPEIESRVREAPDPFEAAVRTAIAGNIIDFGTGVHGGGGRMEDHSGADGFDLQGTLDQYLTKPLFIDHVREMRRSISRAETVLYLGDNAGETVFDRPLLGLLGNAEVIYAAKGGAIINDATVPDATLAGIHLDARLVSSGARTPGTIPDECSAEFQGLFHNADVVIAKGQGNFETLTELPRDGRIFMLFSIKCPVAGRYLQGSIGDMVVMRW